MKTRIKNTEDFVEGGLYQKKYSVPVPWSADEEKDILMFIGSEPYYNKLAPNVQHGYLLIFFSLEEKQIRQIHMDHIQKKDIMIYKI